MQKGKFLRLKIGMLIANFISNFIGVSIVMFLNRLVHEYPSSETLQTVHRIDMIFMPCAFILPYLVTVRYERPEGP